MDGYVVSNHGDRVRPLNGVMGLLINGSRLINGDDPNYLRPSWDDPPSMYLHQPATLIS